MALINGGKERSCMGPGARKGPWPKLLNISLWLCQWAVNSVLYIKQFLLKFKYKVMRNFQNNTDFEPPCVLFFH